MAKKRELVHNICVELRGITGKHVMFGSEIQEEPNDVQ